MQQAAPQAGSNAPQASALNPQQTQQMQLVITQAMQTLLPKQVADGIVAAARHGDPAEVIARYVMPLMRRIWGAAKQAGQQVDMVTMMVAAYAVIAQLSEMLWHAGVIQSPQEAVQLSAKAAQIAVQQHNAQVGAAGQQPPGQPAMPAQPQPPAGGAPMGGV